MVATAGGRGGGRLLEAVAEDLPVLATGYVEARTMGNGQVQREPAHPPRAGRAAVFGGGHGGVEGDHHLDVAAGAGCVEDAAVTGVEADVADEPVAAGPEEQVARAELAAGDGPVGGGLVLRGGGAGELGAGPVGVLDEAAAVEPDGGGGAAAAEEAVAVVAEAPAGAAGSAAPVRVRGADPGGRPAQSQCTGSAAADVELQAGRGCRPRRGRDGR